MNKLKKMLLISFLISLNGCKLPEGAPRPPNIQKCGLVKSDQKFIYLYCQMSETGEKFNLTIEKALEEGTVCTNIEGYIRQEEWAKNLAEKYCTK